MAFFSIIIPTYNSEKFVVECCQSIINQNFKDYEILIQDGLSTDNTLLEIDKISIQHPGVELSVISEKDFGIYDAMNSAVMRASGAWLLFLGSDDKLFDSEVLSAAFEKLQDTDASLVYGNAKLVGASIWAKGVSIYDGPFTVEKLFTKNICHQSIFYNRSVFDEIGFFNIRYRICADWDFNFRCFAKTPVRYIDQIIATFSGGGMSNTSFDEFRQESIFNLKNYFNINYFNPLFKTYSWVFLYHSITTFKSRKILKSCHYLLLSFFHAEDKWLLFKIVLRKMINRSKI